jgi:hypothetical protein
MKKILFIFIFAAVTSSHANPISNKTSVEIKYGYHSVDEFNFKRQKDFWNAQFIDRDSKNGDQLKVRMFPNSIVEKRLFQLEYLIKRFEKKITTDKGSPCTSHLIVVTESTGLKTEKSYCLEKLTQNEDQQFAVWFRDTSLLFQF